MERVRLVYIVTHAMTARYLLSGQPSFMQNKGLDCYLFCSPGKDLELVAEREGVTAIPIPIEREINIFADCVTLIRLYLAIKKLRPMIVNASTPKAGFLGMLAACMTRVPVRIYTLRGLRLETTKGVQRFILSWTERIAAACAQRVICVSESLRRKCIELGLTDEKKTIVIGAGSSNGVDVERFESGNSDALRKDVCIPADAPVIGFVGRLTRDKGIAELVEAFEILLHTFINLHLLVIGDFEDGDPVQQEIAGKLNQHPQIKRVGFISDPAPYYRVMDVLAFPSHREGFPNTPLEAAASGIPTVGFRVTGTVDAVEHGVTGLLVPSGDVQAFAAAIAEYLKSPQLKQDHGRAAKERVYRLFRNDQIWNSLYQEYMNLSRRAAGVSNETDI